MPETNTPYVVLVGIDYTPVSALAFATAHELASLVPNAELHVAHLVSPPWLVPGELSAEPNPVVPVLAEVRQKLARYVDEQLAALPDRASVMPRSRVLTHVRTDTSESELALLASDLEADLVVVGTHGRAGFPRLVLGSIAETTVRTAPCPVLVVRPKATPGTAQRLRSPCPDCLSIRRQTARSELWCNRHRATDGQREGSVAIRAEPSMTVVL
jgi:universal stress protein A